MNIVVCAKLVPNPDRILDEDWAAFAPEDAYGYAGSDWGCFEKAALEMALRLKDTCVQKGTAATCTALTLAKDLPAPVAQQLYAAGFDRVICLQAARREFCPSQVGQLLAEEICALGADLVLTGAQAGCSETGLVPCWLAETLGWPLAAETEEAEWQAESLCLRCRRPEGLLERLLPLPAVVSVSSSPLVLRCATLRARMQVRGKTAELHPAAQQDTAPAPALHCPDTGRTCQMLDGKDPSVGERLWALLTRAAQAGESVPAQNPAAAPKPQQDVLWAEPCPAGETDTAALVSVYDAAHPRLLLLPDTAEGRILAVHLARERALPCLSGATVVGQTDSTVTVQRRVCSSHLDWTHTLPLPAVLTVPAAARDVWQGAALVQLPRQADAVPERLLESTPPTGLANASLVLVCGCGIGSKDTCDKVRALAEKLGAGFGLTRPAALQLWGSPAEIVGQSGVTLSPEVCIVLGAAGAGAFAVGIEHAKTVIAVNTDPEALIFRSADFGLQMDAAAFTEWLGESYAAGASAVLR